MKKKICLLFMLLLFMITNNYAQSFRYDTVPAPYQTKTKVVRQIPQQSSASEVKVEKKSGFDLSKLVIGGSLGFAFGNHSTSINISPQVGYAFSKYLTAGGGVSYTYYDYRSSSQNYLGLNLFGRAYPIDYLTIQVQPELYSMWGSYSGVKYDNRVVPCLLVGAGITIPAGRGGVNMMLYYDVVQDDWSPYSSEIFYSVGYIFNF